MWRIIQSAMIIGKRAIIAAFGFKGTLVQEMNFILKCQLVIWIEKTFERFFPPFGDTV